MRTLRRTGLVMVLALMAISRLSGQGGSPPPGRAYLFVLDLQGTPLDEFPNSVKALNGTMTVVDKDGQHMLRASSPSELLITLPQALPPVFTVEVDLIPKSCCNPEDFMLEGTPARNRGVASVELTWHPSHIMAVGGGGEMYQSDMPADLAASTPGNPTHVVVEFNGTTIKLYTNGRRLYTLDKQFARGRVLRVWLGGQDEGVNAVYLAGLRVGTGPAATGVIAGRAGLPGAAGGAAAGVPGPTSKPQPQLPTGSTTYVPPVPGGATASSSQGLTAGSVPTVVANVTVTQGSAGPVVSWLPVAVSATYTVKRWKSDDQACCNNSSPSLTGPPWQDVPLPVAGTYVYEVTATMTGGVAIGQTQFVNFKQGGQIASITPAATAPTAVLADPTTTGTITPISPSPAPTPPTAPAPGTAGASALVLGPATLTAVPLGWGVDLFWPEVVGGTEYRIERSATGQPFATIATIRTGDQPPQGGMFSRGIQSMQPGSTTFYRVRAILSDGTLTPYSPVVRHDAPAQAPYISKLIGRIVPPANPGSVGFVELRWDWAAINGVEDATQYAIQTDVFAPDPSGALVPVPGGHLRTASAARFYQAEFQGRSGNSVRFCISVVFPPGITEPLQYAVCQATAIP